MARPIAVPALAFALVVCDQAATFAANVTYLIEPVTLNHEFAIDGGSITTNGTLGPLSSSDILDYEVRVSGPYPYVFRPSNPSKAVIVSGVLDASSATLELPEVPEAGSLLDASNRFSFWARDNASADCTNCLQFIGWENIWTSTFPSGELRKTAITYNFSELGVPNPNPNVLVSNAVFGSSDGILVATIPEPSSLLLFLFALHVFLAGASGRTSIARRGVGAKSSRPARASF